MRLKKLELQGYKTFASRAEFVFDNGITAIVGPNGSGKSNIADAIRWVLGEQSYRLLRAKRTEDLIFAGSQKRARSGMTQVTIVLDNQGGELPIDFAEVAIGRRAFRSGENEYYLNNSRVRLRDTVDLLGASGLGQRTYSVIGQGLIDAALALRADERRALFEEAAGIALYKERRQESLAKLEATQRNLERVDDILGEIRPRMRQLERQSARSRECAQITADLENLLYLWYGYHWEAAKRDLRKARVEAADQADLLKSARADQARVEQQLNLLRKEAQRLRGELGDWHRQGSRLHEQAESNQRDLAVHLERWRLLGQQQAELEGDAADLESQKARAEARVLGAERVLADSAEIWQQQQVAVNHAHKTLSAAQQVAETLRREEQLLARERMRLESQVGITNSRRIDLNREVERLKTEDAGTQGELEGLCSDRSQKCDALTKLETKLAAAEQESVSLEKIRATATAARKDANRDSIAARLVRDQTMAAVIELQAQQNALGDLRAQGAGHDETVSQLLAALDRPVGIIAPVAQLLHVPEAWEGAVAAVLGHNCSALVVRDWQVVQGVTSHPAVEGASVTLLPLDEIRAPEPPQIPDDPAVVGLGSDLVECLPEHRPVADLLLGRAVLVRSRHAARRLFRSVPPGVCTVSIDDGWIFHQDGRVIKPGADTGRSLLAQEREWRSLPDRLQTARANSAEAQAVLDTSEQAVAAAEARLTDLDGQERTLRAAVQDLRHDRDTAMRELDRLDQVVQWKRNQLDEIKRQIEAADASALDLAGDERELQRRQEENRVGLSRIAGQLAAVPIETLSAELARHQRALAQTEGARRHEQELVETHRRALQQLDSQIAFRRRRAEAVSVEREELLLLLASQREEADRLGEQIAKIGGEITPIEVQLAEIESQLDSMQSDEDGARRRVRAAEQIESRVQVALDRREAHLGHLATRINEELGLVNMPLDDDISGQTPLPLGEMVGELPVVRVLPDGLDDTIQQRRQQIKRLGPTNPDAPAEFAELKQRYTFLTDQVRDLRETDTRLRQVIAELDSVMDREFQRVFEAVAAEFKHTFSRLFGGGTARLVLTDPDKPIHSGVEIVARPPGRRQQGLALLSGGERSLTAAALVFSLLKVSPTPFCVLDEVDAMLDEANIGRFRDMLTELSQHTQFIIITHNWGTVQAADTIYGVSLAEDGTSQVVSLRLDGEKLRAE